MSTEAREMLGWLSRAEHQRLVHVSDVRPEYAETMRHKDRLGREEGHWMGGLTYATLCAGVGVGVKEVPGDFWSLDVTDDGYPCAVVACPCGAAPTAEALAPMVPCDCARHFFYDGQNVWAFASPTREPDDATVVPS